ncbi:MAG: hypothetical protein COB78_00550 [Hyphomicrobiales bacterium]|nr:MAG: hypothetical protein COB78_00550 [Hyphomicrobiales bacterium]
MIDGLTRAWDNLFGLGEAAVTVPPLDGSLLANRKLDEASARFPLDGVDSLTVVAGKLLASSGNTLYALKGGKNWNKHSEYEADIACIATIGNKVLAVALVTGDILIKKRQYKIAENVRCITAIASSDTHLYITNGSATNSPDDWQLDLLQRNASGSIWQIDLESGESTQIADNLAYPAGLVVDGTTLVYSESWKHRLVKIDISNPKQKQIVHADLPGYPGRIKHADDGYWLTVFAPRSQLVEYVLRETAYRKRMVVEVPRPYWIAPKLRSGRSFYEPLQGGGVKHFGLLKPWAPTMSAGLCVKLDSAFQPNLSLHSRADGTTHGVTDITEYKGSVYAAARGDNIVVSIPLKDVGDEE